MTVESATLAGAGPGECRVVFTAADPASLVLEALRPDGSTSLRRLGRRPVRAKGVVRWGVGRPHGRRARRAPGALRRAGLLSDAARNREPAASAPAGWGTWRDGRSLPTRSPRQAVGAALRTTGGDALPPSTPVTLTLRRRTGMPGVTAADPLGRPGRRWAPEGRRSGSGSASPPGINPDALWLVAKAAGRRPGDRADHAGGPAVIEAMREVAAVGAAVGVVGLLAPLPALRSEAQRAGALAVMIVSWGFLAASLVPEGDASRGLDRLGSPARAGAPAAA